MATKDYYNELDRIVRQARLNRKQRFMIHVCQWLSKALLKCSREHISESKKTELKALVINCKLIQFLVEVVDPLNKAMLFISQERNLGNYLTAFTEENVHPQTLITNSEIFDILLKLPPVKIHNSLSQLYPDHYQQLVAALDTGDKMYFVRYVDEQRLNMYPLRNLCSCFLVEHRMSQYMGDLSLEEFKQFFAEVGSVVQAGELEIDKDILKLSNILTDSPQFCNSETTDLLEEFIRSYYYLSLTTYLLHREQLNSLEQQAIETIVKNPRYISYYNDVYEAYQKVNAEVPGLKERILQKEQTLRLKPTKPIEQSPAKAETNNRMPKKPDNITEEQIPLLVDKLVEAGFINKEGQEKFIYFLRGRSGSYKEPLQIKWNKSFFSLKYLFQTLLYSRLPKDSNKPINNNFDYEKPTEGDKYNPDTVRNTSKKDLLPLIDEKEKADLDQIMAQLKS